MEVTITLPVAWRKRMSSDGLALNKRESQKLVQDILNAQSNYASITSPETFLQSVDEFIAERYRYSVFPRAYDTTDPKERIKCAEIFAKFIREYQLWLKEKNQETTIVSVASVSQKKG